MPHHYTKNTVEAQIWCRTCGKMTQWRVLGGRQSHCLACYEKKQAEPTKKEQRPEQANLFGHHD